MIWLTSSTPWVRDERKLEIILTTFDRDVRMRKSERELSRGENCVNFKSISFSLPWEWEQVFLSTKLIRGTTYVESFAEDSANFYANFLIAFDATRRRTLDAESSYEPNYSLTDSVSISQYNNLTFLKSFRAAELAVYRMEIDMRIFFTNKFDNFHLTSIYGNS